MTDLDLPRGARMKRAGVAVICASAMLSGCSLIGDVTGGRPSSTPPPAEAPKAMVSEETAGRILVGHSTHRGAVSLRYDARVLSRLETASLYEIHRAELKILERTRERVPIMEGVSGNVMLPKMPGRPKWYVGQTVDRDKRFAELVVFVQQKQGGKAPVKAVAAPILDQAA
ncbi:MAG: hypothetical protein GEV11_30105 [Streptosporangiales bacterium]|nr:hypothetical protein [Streptosporangiales bacterium]